MRVGLVLEQCLAPVPGGTGRYSRELAQALVRQAPPGSVVHGVTAFHRRGLAVPDLPVRRLPLPRRALVAAWERGWPPRVGGDVVHALTPLSPARHGRLVVTVHDAVPWTHPETLTPRGARWHRAMVERAAREADLVVVPTQAVADELSRHVPLAAVRVVGEGTSRDLALPPDAAERADRLGLPERYLLTVATLEPRKGLADLVEVLPRDVPLLVAGQPGWGAVDVAALAAAAGADVRVLGRVTDPDLAVLLDRAAALVVPSRAEGFGLPLLEGMAAGTPVVTTDVPALVEVAGGAALCVPRGALGEAIRSVLDSPSLRQRLARDGQQRARTFTWDGAARALWKAYAEIPDR